MAAERRVQYSRKATLDLDRIWDYTAEAWGADQAEVYLESLRSTILILSEMPQLARERRDLTPPVRVHPSGKHLIAYMADDTSLTVIRILSPRQDWQTLLGET